jgi:2-polyprenyl-6-methoxyphenol hydroxylase and related FAD-dependent oxidoreductases
MKKIAIIGAGISGLFFANLLKNNSEYDFVIFEKKTSIDLEDGYGIQLSVNSVKLLNKVGFSEIDQNQIYNPKMIHFLDAKDNKKICDLDISKFNLANNQYTTLQRSTLLKFFLDNISKDKIKFNYGFKNLTYGKKLNLTFDNNQKIECDYLVVADGIFSKTKSIILNKDTRPKYFNSLALRANIDDFINEDISLYFGSNFHFVIYPN